MSQLGSKGLKIIYNLFFFSILFEKDFISERHVTIKIKKCNL